jgi:glyoxylase-like metal-dependent hydrolase (beta-lactamase superfamily II)
VTPDEVAQQRLPRHRVIGGGQLWALTDGVFRPTPDYFGVTDPSKQTQQLFARGNALGSLPLGAFLYRSPHGRLVAVDAGQGPVHYPIRDAGHGDLTDCGDISGGLLPQQFEAIGINPDEVTDVVLTHLHSDHIGWLVRPSDAMFANATVWCGRADYEYFVREQPAQLAELYAEQRLVLLDDQLDLNAELQIVPAPGHTPGHLVVSIREADRRYLLLGDAVTCPEQLGQPSWHSVGDVDVGQAERTRRWLWQELAKPGTIGTGSHFPAADFGRVVGTDGGRRWETR